jgi:hypothetical protein
MAQGGTLKREVLKRERFVSTSSAASAAIGVSIGTALITASLSCREW